MTSNDDSDFAEEFDAGLEYGKEIRARFFSPRIDDPGLPYADSLVCVCGALFLASLGLKGIVPLQSWLNPLPGVPVAGYRGLPYILPALSHGAALAACWLLGALASSAFEREAFMGSAGDALSRTWKAGAFATGMLLLCTQFTTFVSFSLQGLDYYGPLGASREADMQIISTAFELICDVAVSAVGLTAFRLYRWRDAQDYR